MSCNADTLWVKTKPKNCPWLWQFLVTGPLFKCSSKNKDDEVCEEDEFEGRGKFQELTKVANCMWLIDSLATTQVLQELLTLNLDIKSLNKTLAFNKVSAPLDILELFGLNDSIIAESTRALISMTVLSYQECPGIILICLAYLIKRENEKCFETLNILKKKLVKQPQAPFELEMEDTEIQYYDKLDEFIDLTEVLCLLHLGQTSLALSKTEEVVWKMYTVST